MTFTYFRIALSCGLMALLLVGQPAHAMQLTPDQKQEILQHYERATRAYDIQKYSEAVEEYQKAYEIGGDPAMLYNVAQAFRLNDQVTEALHAYRRYLQRSPNARNRADVERKIGELEKKLEAQRKAAEVAAASVSPAPVAGPTSPGEAPTPVLPAARLITVPDGPPSHKLRNTGIVLASVGVAALGVSVATGVLAAKKGDDLTKASMNGDRFDPGVESSGKKLNTITIISAIAGGALAATGTVLMIVAAARNSTAETPVATLTPLLGADGGGFGLAAAGHF
ncbi:MAG TPA: tetratricopeptide repeat protein [Polyangia bacterium]|nr:tetratricopeptide repeat protein [Polyangia bacterium]